MEHSKKEVIIYVLSVVVFIAAAVFYRYLTVKFFYGGDMRCFFAECRINK